MTANGNMAPEEGTLLWARPDGAAGPGSLELLRAAVREFKLGVHCCTYGELPELIRTRRCELVGIELGADAEAAVALIKRLHDRLPTLTIFAASDDPGVSVLRAVLEAGASDVLSLPLGRQELHKALIRFSQLRTKTGPAQAAGSVLTVYGVRGGLGATTLAVNLAARLHAALECETALVDLDENFKPVWVWSVFDNLDPNRNGIACEGLPGTPTASATPTVAPSATTKPLPNNGVFSDIMAMSGLSLLEAGIGLSLEPPLSPPVVRASASLNPEPAPPPDVPDFPPALRPPEAPATEPVAPAPGFEPLMAPAPAEPAPAAPQPEPQPVPAVDEEGNTMVLWKARVLNTGRFRLRVHSSIGLTQTKIITITRPSEKS